MQKIKVIPIISESGNIVKNHYIIETEEGSYLQSYEDIIAFRPSSPNEFVVLDSDNWDCSTTTRKWLEVFLGESHNVTREKLLGYPAIYLDANLNKNNDIEQQK